MLLCVKIVLSITGIIPKYASICENKFYNNLKCFFSKSMKVELLGFILTPALESVFLELAAEIPSFPNSPTPSCRDFSPRRVQRAQYLPPLPRAGPAVPRL